MLLRVDNDEADTRLRNMTRRKSSLFGAIFGSANDLTSLPDKFVLQTPEPQPLSHGTPSTLGSVAEGSQAISAPRSARRKRAATGMSSHTNIQRERESVCVCVCVRESVFAKTKRLTGRVRFNKL